MTRQDMKKYTKSGIVFIALIAITFFTIFKGIGFRGLVHAIGRIDPLPLIPAVICGFLYIACEGLNLHEVLRCIGSKPSLFRCLQYSLSGFFFCGITPSSTGGQPMQMYFMKRDGIPLSHSSITTFLVLVCYQFTSIVLTVSAILLNFKFMLHSPPFLKVILVFSLSINAATMILIGFCMFSGKLVKRIAAAAFKLILRIKFIKLPENAYQKTEEWIEEYRHCANVLRKKPLLVIKILAITLIQMIFMYSVGYFVYRSFGLAQLSYFSIIGLQAIITAAASGMPMPGAVGVAESGFLMLYVSIYPKSMLRPAMAVSRGISFYLYILVGAIVTGIMLRRKRQSNAK